MNGYLGIGNFGMVWDGFMESGHLLLGWDLMGFFISFIGNIVMKGVEYFVVVCIFISSYIGCLEY